MADSQRPASHQTQSEAGGAPDLKPWGAADEDLARQPLAFREDLLQGQTFLISGGGSGIGRAIAYTCARLGADVMICGRREEKLAETARGIREKVGREIGISPMTIRDPEAVRRLIDDTYRRFGRLDTLVNNGGGQFPQAAIDFSVKGWLAVIDTNLNGTWYMMQAAAQQWRERGKPGNIVNIVANVWRGMPQVAHTCAARAGVIYLSKTVSTEWAPLGIRVNCVSPGSIDSDGLNVYQRHDADKFRYSNPMRQLGDALDIAQAVVYLSAPTGKFITGDVLVVDGGNNQHGQVWPAGIPDYFRLPET
ncbi:MAG TPA: SDR family oxidoreductase [Steroidobacteraceae bacterium]|nr:SDR family oxidoreductase [Steroidobacteraceae bacterium]